MRIDQMQASDWEKLEEKIQTNTSKYQGRKFICIKEGTLRWFGSEKSAVQRGYSPLNLNQIEQLAKKALSEEGTSSVVKHYSHLLKLREARLLLRNPSAQAADLEAAGVSLISANDPLGKQLVRQAMMKYEQANNPDKVFACRNILIEHFKIDASHPLYSVETSLEGSANRGMNFLELDHGDVKRGIIHGIKKNVDGKELLQANFKVSYPCRKQLESDLKFIRANQEAFEHRAKELGCEGVVIQEVEDVYMQFQGGIFHSEKAVTVGKSLEIHFVGMGKIRLGNQPNVGCSYNRLEIETDAQLQEGEFARKANAMLTSIGLLGTLEKSGAEDEERKKVMLLFHTFYPQQAYEIEKLPETFTANAKTLKEAIIFRVPKMKEVFLHYDEHPELIEGLAIKDLSQLVRANGGIGLMSGIVANDPVKAAVAMLKTGILSTQARYESGLLVEGASSSQDYISGGGECVFTRLITKEAIQIRTRIEKFDYHGKVQMLFDLDVLEQGAYAYPVDSFGWKNRFGGSQEKYSERKNLLEFTNMMNEGFQPSNEVMVKGQISPQFIRGIVVNSFEQKKAIIQLLREEGLLYEEDGEEKINGKHVAIFIQVSSVFKEEMWRTT